MFHLTRRYEVVAFASPLSSTVRCIYCTHRLLRHIGFLPPPPFERPFSFSVLFAVTSSLLRQCTDAGHLLPSPSLYFCAPPLSHTAHHYYAQLDRVCMASVFSRRCCTPCKVDECETGKRTCLVQSEACCGLCIDCCCLFVVHCFHLDCSRLFLIRRSAVAFCCS